MKHALTGPEEQTRRIGSPGPRGPEELELPNIYTTVLHTSCTVIIFLSITFRINNIWNRYHPLRMTRGGGLSQRGGAHSKSPSGAKARQVSKS
jgi:hypothetical protein